MVNTDVEVQKKEWLMFYESLLGSGRVRSATADINWRIKQLGEEFIPGTRAKLKRDENELEALIQIRTDKQLY